MSDSTKLITHMENFPSPYYTKKTDSNLKKLLKAISVADDYMAGEIDNARKQRFLMTAEGKYLSAFGSNVNTPRPAGFRMSEDVYRELVRLMGYHPKQIYPIFAKLAQLFWGERCLIDQVVQIYNVDPSQITIIINALAPIIAARFKLIDATYLHEDAALYPTFPSGYVFNPPVISALNRAHNIGETILELSVNEDDFPTGPFVIAIGNGADANYEVKYATGRVNQYVQLGSSLLYSHSISEAAYIPQYPKGVQTTTTQILTAGHSYSYINMTNTADFPDRQGAIWLNYDRFNAELVPYRARIYNNRLEIDPTYVFQYSHGIGSIARLCCIASQISKDGRDYPFKLTDTESLRAYIVGLFERVKREAVRLEVIFE